MSCCVGLVGASATRQRRLGAVLAGGKSSRFGSDKALAMLEGKRLLDRAVAALEPYCDKVVVVGRSDSVHDCVPDWPQPDCGPLGGVAGAFEAARERGYDEVLTSGVDSVALPDRLTDALWPAPAYLDAQPVVGLWRAEAAGALEEIMFGKGKHSMRAFAERISARPVKLSRDPVNINTAADLERVQRHGL
jgi:molybdopterin-guanine dinucleotide biosynthesis protein A